MIFSITNCKRYILLKLVGILILLTIFEIIKSDCYEQWNRKIFFKKNRTENVYNKQYDFDSRRKGS